jgi:Na+/glutamate symporter
MTFLEGLGLVAIGSGTFASILGVILGLLLAKAARENGKATRELIEKENEATRKLIDKGNEATRELIEKISEKIAALIVAEGEKTRQLLKEMLK